MRILLWIGNEENQRALANKIHQNFELCGIVAETRVSRRRITFIKIIEKVFERLFLPQINKAWFGMLSYYKKKYPEYPHVAIINVENINSHESYLFSKELDPDLILVSGTRIIRQKLLNIKPSVGILNLHTGLSPYIKGGPNCTNWCIATKRFHLIGNTIMWIDKGIDTGDILLSDFVDFDGNERLIDVHIKVMEHAHALYINAIKKILKKNMPGVKQDNISNGKTFFNSQWGLNNKIKLVFNMRHFRKYINKEETLRMREYIKVVSFDGN